LIAFPSKFVNTLLTLFVSVNSYKDRSIVQLICTTPGIDVGSGCLVMYVCIAALEARNVGRFTRFIVACLLVLLLGGWVCRYRITQNNTNTLW
jgi:hypothetical protein